MQDAIRELHPYQVHLRSCSFKRGSTRSFLRATESLVADPPDALALAPVLPEEAHRLVERLPPHIPICCFDTELPGGRASYVGQDAQASGKLAAKLMRLLLTPATSPVIIQPVTEDVHIRGRVEGFLAGFAGRGGVDAKRGVGAGEPAGDANRGGAAGEPSVPLYVEPMADAAAARELVTRVFAEHPHAGGIFVTNALVHLVARALIDLGRADLPLVGYDVLPENRAFLETGAIDFLISQRPHLQGKRAITLLFEALQAGSGGGQAGAWPKREIMPLDMVTAENIQYYTDVSIDA
jgi:LacI family transcriptional regulator